MASGKHPAGILAKRAMEAVEAKSPKKKKGKSGHKALQELKKAVSGDRKRRKDDSTETSGSYEEEEDEPSDNAGGWEAKRKRFKRIAERSPGQLMMHSLEDMDETLGSKFGDARSKEDTMSPIVTRYLLSVITPAIGGRASKSAMRELRTIALATDMILKGKAESAGDILLQRFKSLCMQVRDGSDKFAPQIELLPEDMLESRGIPG